MPCIDYADPRQVFNRLAQIQHDMEKRIGTIDALTVTQADPGLRGDTATGGQKPAKLETGATVRVPLFINEGEVIRIDTRTGEYISRAKQ